MATNKDTLKITANAQNKVKEDNKMKKFEIAGIEYRFNTESGRYSKVEGGKTKRISKAEYEEAASKPVNIKKIPCSTGEHVVELAKIGDEYGIRLVGEEEFKPMSKSEFKSEIDKRDANGRFETSFEYMGRKYWLKDAIEKTASKKGKRSSRSKKNAAYKKQVGDVEITLTEKQVDFFKHMEDTSFWENGLDSVLWIDVLCDEIGGQFANKPMTIGAMISTLREKELVVVGRDSDRKGKPKFMTLTDLGKKVAKDLGLK